MGRTLQLMVVLAACSAVLSRGQATMFQQTNYYSNPDCSGALEFVVVTAAANVPGGRCYETTCEPTSQLDHGVRITCVDTFEGELTAGQYVEIQLNCSEGYTQSYALSGDCYYDFRTQISRRYSCIADSNNTFVYEKCVDKYCQNCTTEVITRDCDGVCVVSTRQPEGYLSPDMATSIVIGVVVSVLVVLVIGGSIFVFFNYNKRGNYVDIDDNRSYSVNAGDPYRELDNPVK